jgi:hypothetical protein
VTNVGLTACILLAAASLVCGCTSYHSKQAICTPAQDPPSSDAMVVTEQDSGLLLLSLFEVAEPDHYAVLLERARERYACERMHHPQLDFYTVHWVLVAFPIVRVTFVCDRTKPAMVPTSLPAGLPPPRPGRRPGEETPPWQPYPDSDAPGGAAPKPPSAQPDPEAGREPTDSPSRQPSDLESTPEEQKR